MKRHPSSTQTSAHADRSCVHFSISDRIGALDEVLQIIKAHNVNLSRIESRPSKTQDYDYDFFLDLHTKDQALLMSIVQALKPVVKQVKIMGDSSAMDESTPWFPRKKSDMDSFAEKVLEYGDALDADHPGFKDEEYRKRRNMITSIARTYRQ